MLIKATLSLLSFFFTLQTSMARLIQTISMNFMGWLRGIVDTSTYVSSPSGEGTVSVMDAISPKTITAGFVLGLAVTLSIGYTRSPWRKLPPGPRRLPILGNALQLRDKSWLLSKDCKERFSEFTDYIPKWFTKFSTDIAGEIMYLDGAGQPIVVCNSLKSAFELLERRSGNYSDRPRFIMAQEILSGGLLLALMKNDDR
jgi:hypothetical protein